MKRIYLLIIGLLILIPNSINAETFEGNDGTKYYIEQIPIQCDIINVEESRFAGLDKDNNIVVKPDSSKDYYKINTNGCSKMELEEALYFLYNSNGISYELNGNDIYKIERISNAGIQVGDEYKYIRYPESLTPDENKTYYKKTGSNTAAVVTKEEMNQAIFENPYNVYNYFELYDDFKLKHFLNQ